MNVKCRGKNPKQNKLEKHVGGNHISRCAVFAVPDCEVGSCNCAATTTFNVLQEKYSQRKAWCMK